jgi:hypothetical protein
VHLIVYHTRHQVQPFCVYLFTVASGLYIVAYTLYTPVFYQYILHFAGAFIYYRCVLYQF